MKFGVMFANTGVAVEPEPAAALARFAEDAGYESFWTIEHVVVPAGYESAYPYSRSGRMPGGEDQPMPDPLVWLTWIGAATSRLRLGTGVLILPQRNPAVLAKEAATLDHLTGGRLLLGVGVGWLREEFEALGVPFDERGSRTDDYIGALRALWREPESSYRGRFVSFERVKSYPKPRQPGGVPVVVGGHTDAAARRAGRLGDGFFPARARVEELEHLLSVMRTAAADAGRSADAIEVTAGGAMDVDGVRRYADLGVSRLVVRLPHGDMDDVRRQLGEFADDVIARIG